MGGVESKEFWHKDADYPNCEGCQSLFTLTNRRHHCRCCGSLFCNECTSHRGCPINPQTNKPATKEPVRICAKCAKNAISKTVCDCRPERLPNNKNMNATDKKKSELDANTKQNLSRRLDSNLNGNNGGNDDQTTQFDDHLGDDGHPKNGDNANHDGMNQNSAENAQQMAIKARIDQITSELNDNIVNLAPFTSDYGLHFSENPVYGMRIATVVGPVPFALPATSLMSVNNSDGANGSGSGAGNTNSGGDAAADNTAAVAPLLCGDVTEVPAGLVAMTKHPLRDFERIPMVKV